MGEAVTDAEAQGEPEVDGEALPLSDALGVERPLPVARGDIDADAEGVTLWGALMVTVSLDVGVMVVDTVGEGSGEGEGEKKGAAAGGAHVSLRSARLL